MYSQSIIPQSLTTCQRRINDSFLRIGFLEFMKIVFNSLLRFRAFSPSTFLDSLISIALLSYKPITYLCFTLTLSYKIYGHLTPSPKGKQDSHFVRKNLWKNPIFKFPKGINLRKISRILKIFNFKCSRSRCRKKC